MNIRHKKIISSFIGRKAYLKSCRQAIGAPIYISKKFILAVETIGMSLLLLIFYFAMTRLLGWSLLDE